MQTPDSKPGNYYVTAIDDTKRVARLAGPFLNDHASALALVDKARDEACKVDSRAWWYAFGTCRVDIDVPTKLGVLNSRLGIES
jgi:hypothetical protein